MCGRGPNLKKCGSVIQQVRDTITGQHFSTRHMAVTRFCAPPQLRKICGGAHFF
jgi:hypothetical protein